MIWVLIVLVVVGVASGGEQNDCNSIHVSVPEPRLKYMLNGKLYVAWRRNASEASMINYTASYCCTKPSSYYNAKCLHVCPNYTMLEYCSQQEVNSFEVEYSCTFIPNKYIQYFIYLTDNIRGCHFEGNAVNIEPTLTIAHAFGVTYVNMTLRKDGQVQLRWPLPKIRFFEFQMCYFVTCEYFDSKNKKKAIYLDDVTARNALVSFPNRSNTHTSYTCCVKVRGCNMKYSQFSDEQCSKGKFPVSNAVNSAMFSRHYHSGMGLLITLLLFVLQDNGA